MIRIEKTAVLLYEGEASKLGDTSEEVTGQKAVVLAMTLPLPAMLHSVEESSFSLRTGWKSHILVIKPQKKSCGSSGQAREGGKKGMFTLILHTKHPGLF